MRFFYLCSFPEGKKKSSISYENLKEKEEDKKLLSRDFHSEKPILEEKISCVNCREVEDDS